MDTIIEIDPQTENVGVNDSQTTVEKGTKELLPSPAASPASIPRDVAIDNGNQEHNKSLQDTSKEGSTVNEEAIKAEEEVKFNQYECRPAPFSTLEEYNTKMQEDIDAGRAGNRWFFEVSSVDKRECVGSKSKSTVKTPVDIVDITSLYFNDEIEEGIYNPIVCLLLENSAALMNLIELGNCRWRVPNKLRKVIKEQRTGSPVFIRLLMTQQILLQSYDWLIFGFKTSKDETPLGIQLCYMDFIQGACSDSLYDCVLNEDLLPRKIINVFHSDDGNDSRPKKSKQPARVAICVISATGSHMATVSIVGSAAHLDWWELDLKSSTTPVKYPCPASTSTAHTFIGIIERKDSYYISMSLSWDGSQIAMTFTDIIESSSAKSLATKNNQGVLQCLEPGQLMMPYKTQDQQRQIPLDIPKSTRHKNFKELKNFKGDIEFTSSSKEKWDESTERLIASDGKTVTIFSTSGVWQLLYSIHLSSVSNNLNGNFPTQGASGGLFPWLESPYQLSLWSIESRKPVCDIRTTSVIEKCRISFDGRAIAVVTTGLGDTKGIQVFSTETGDSIHPSGFTGDSIGTYFSGVGGLLYQASIPDCSSHFDLVHSDARNLARISSVQCRLQWGDGLDIDYSFSFQGIQEDGKLGSTVIAHYGHSTILVSYLSDFLSGSTDPSRTACLNSECSSKFLPIQDIGGQAALSLFKKSRHVTVVHWNDICPNPLSFSYNAKSFHLLEKHSKLVIICKGPSITALFVWQLPTRSSHTIELLLMLYLDPIPESTTLYTCPHENQLCISYDQVDIHISLVAANKVQTTRFHENIIFTLADMAYKCHDEKDTRKLRDVYLNYLSSIINTPVYDSVNMPIISRICQEYVSLYSKEVISLLFKIVLQHDKPHSWIPLLNYPAGSNPIGILLENTRTNPNTSKLVEKMVEYCIKRANDTQEITYIMFLCDHMGDLTSQYPDLALRVTRVFAYFKCTDRGSVISYAKVIQHPNLSSFWNRKEVPLSQCRNPILQLQSSQVDRAVETFTEEVFVAPLSFLWTFIPDRKDKRQEYSRYDPMATQSAFKTMFYLTKFHINPFRHVYIRTNNYELTVLDNPAFEALIQYKWNTIGFKAWLVRFISQCIFYLLIVSAAAIQIYYPKLDLQLGVFIAIVSFSGIFLWLEFLQWQDYLKASTPRKLAKKKVGFLRKVSRVIKIITKPFRKLSAAFTGGSSSEDKKENQETSVEGPTVEKEAEESQVIEIKESEESKASEAKESEESKASEAKKSEESKASEVKESEESKASEVKEASVVVLENVDEEKKTGDDQEQEAAGAQEDEAKETNDQNEEKGSEQGDGDESDTEDRPDLEGAGPLFFRSQYDLLDFFMYSISIATGIHHIVNTVRGRESDTWDLSFCIIFVFLHMLSELRVSEIVCKYVTIVFDILNEIKVFFLVLAGGVLVFSLAILHAVHAPGVTVVIGGFPKVYHGAIATVIFIMGGRYDALSKNLMDENGEYLNWPLQILLLTYFFFAVIVMLNVLIALVNAAYTKGESNWRQVWFQNRLQTIVRAENLSYHIPGYRSSHDYFPDRIFYTATPYQVRKYRRRIKTADEDIVLDTESTEEPTNSSSDTPASTGDSETTNCHTADKDDTSPNDPDPSSLERKPTGAVGMIRQRPSRDQLTEASQRNQAQQDQKQAGKKEVFDMRTDMTKLKDGMTGLKGEVKGMKNGLTDLQEEISDVKEDIRAILAALTTLQQIQVRKE